MSYIKSHLSFKVGMLTFVGIFVVVGSVLALAPRKIANVKAEDCAVYDYAVFNPFPVTWADSGDHRCEDFAVVSAGVHGSGAWSSSVSPRVGDTVTLQIWVHNGAAQNSGKDMHGVRATTRIDYNSGSVSTTLSANGIPSITGDVSINLPAGAHLELVSGDLNIDIGELEPCFDAAQIHTLSVRVVGPVETVNPTGEIHTSLGSQVYGQCLYDGSISWSTSGVSSAEVTVRDPETGSESLYSGDLSSTGSSAPWLTPGQNYRFTLWNTSSGSRQHLSETWLVVPNDLTCGGTPPPPNQTHSLEANYTNQLSGQCLYTGYVRWETSGYNSVLVTVDDLDDGQGAQDHSTALSGDAPTPWLTPNHRYVYKLYDTSSGSQTFLEDESFTVPNASCGPTQTSSLEASYTDQLSGQCLYTGYVRWNTSGYSSVLVTVDDLDDSDAAQQHSTALSGDAPTPWLTPNHRYVYKLYDTSSGSQTFLKEKSFTVPNASCGPTETPAPACAPFIQTVRVNNPAGLTASSGTGSFTWSAPGGQLSSTSGSSVNVTYSSIGDKLVTVSSGGKSATCGVRVEANPTPVCPSGNGLLSFSPNPVQVNQSSVVLLPTGWSGGSAFTSNNSGIASVSGITVVGRAQGTATISASGFSAPNGATGCSLNGSISVASLPPPPPPPPACPSGVTFAVNPTPIQIGGTGSIALPAGWSGGSFTSDNPGIASVSGLTVTGRSVGSVFIYGTGLRAPSGATGCSIAGATNVSPLPPPPLVCPTGASLSFSRTTIPVNETSTIILPSGWSGGSFTSDNSGIASVSGTIITGRAQGTTAIRASGVTASNGATGCSLSGSISVTFTPPPPPPPVCPTNASVFVNPSIIYINEFSTASAPAGWTSGIFSSNYRAVADFVDGFRGTSIKGFSAGSAQISGSGWTAPNGAINCNLNPDTLTVRQRPVTPPTQVTATATASASASAYASCPDGSQASASASASATATATAATQSEAYQLAYDRAFAQAQASAFAQAQAKVVCNGTPPPPVVPTLVCTTLTPSVLKDQDARFSATGGTGTYSWSTSFGNPDTGSGSNFTTRFRTSGNKVVSVNSGDQNKICTVVVNEPETPPGQPNLVITKQVKNLGPSQTTGFSSSVNAKLNDIVSYEIVVSNTGNEDATQVVISDSSIINSNATNLTVSRSYQGSLQTGIHLGTLADGASVTIRYNARVSIEQGEVRNVASVSANNSSSKQAIAIVIVVKDAPPANTGGNCNNSNNSCNNNTNTNTNTNTNSTNSSNQNNNSNINGNNNTVTQTNQNCVNNSCNNTNIVYINQTGGTVPGNDYRQLAITKLVRSVNGGAFQDSVTVNNNDTVEFEVVVRNTGNQVVNNVQMTDSWNGQMSLVSGTVRVDGNYSSDNLNNINLGSILSGQQKRVTFQARVNSGSNQSIQNTARAWGDSASQVQDDAWVFVNVGCTVNCGSVQGGSVNLVYSKKAINETKNTDATTVIASKEDYITYTLTVTNTGNTPATSFVITDDLSQVLPYADMVDNGGGILSGNVISYPGITVPSGGSVSKSFKVRVKYNLAANLSYTMTNTYGNTVTVRINTPQVLGAFVAPKTGGPSVAIASIFGSLMAGGMAVIRNRRKVWELIVD